MKTCFKCNQEKPLTEFYKHKKMADGHLNKCKDCAKKDVHNHRHGKGRNYVLEYDRIRSKRPERIKAKQEYAKTDSGKAVMKKARKNYKTKYPERSAAQIAFNNAVRDGKIKPWVVCSLPECDKKPEAHHPDYSRPFDVVWLCRTHHKQVHATARKELQMS